MLAQSAKRWVLGSFLGRLLMSGRDTLQLVRAALRTPESVGTLANDQLATLLVTRLCRPASTFLDVGAHIGSILAAVAQRDPSIRIVAIEAIPEKAERLRRKFPFATVHACAAGDHEGEVSFFIDTRQSGYSSLGSPTGNNHDGIRQVRRVRERRWRQRCKMRVGQFGRVFRLERQPPGQPPKQDDSEGVIVCPRIGGRKPPADQLGRGVPQVSVIFGG